MATSEKRKTRIVYIHGDGVTHWDWGWVSVLKTELDNCGIANVFELFPDSIEARARYWLPFLKDRIRAGANDVLLAWSCGTLAAMRYAESQAVRELVLISPYYRSDHTLVRNTGYLDKPWEWSAIRKNTSRISIFCSDNDPHIENEQFWSVAEYLQAEITVIPGAGHFNEQETFPELTSFLLDRYT